MNDFTATADTEIPALRKRKIDGEPYCRPPEIEYLLQLLVQIESEEALARARIRRRSAPGWLPGECLIHMLRRAGRAKNRRQYNRWCELVLERVRAALPRVGEGTSPDILEVADHAFDRFVGLLGPDLEGYDERLDIWEARFDLALANLRRDAFRRNATLEDSDTIAVGDDPALLNEMERALGAFDPFDPAKAADDDFRSKVWDAIDALPTEQNRILTMMREGLPVGSGAAGEPSISGILGRTPRTILNQKLRAFAAIRRAVTGEAL